MCATSGALPQLLQQPSQITSHPSQIATTKTCMHHTKHSYFFTLQGYKPRWYKVIVLLTTGQRVHAAPKAAHICNAAQAAPLLPCNGGGSCTKAANSF